MSKKEIPVYLFTGFLDAGKTTFIQETLEDPGFNDGCAHVHIAVDTGMSRIGLTPDENGLAILRAICSMWMWSAVWGISPGTL